MNAPSPLTRLIGDMIAADGPIGLDRYMALALGHPVHGYYRTRDPLGATGDFTTAPEISQMFGELIGVWSTAVFGSLGSPKTLRLVELGPGRGTLMADFLRAAAVSPQIIAALDIHLVETSPVLRDKQTAALGASPCPTRWHASIDTLPEGPMLVIANEFFDALPVRQHIRTPRGWCERLVGLAETGSLAFGLAAEPETRMTLAAPLGAVLETGASALAIARRLAERIAREGGAALFIDYGYVGPRFGETLQALRHHRFVDPLDAPGEVDLTTHVDFSALGRAAAGAGAIVHGPVAQGAFLRDLGIGARADRLAARHPASVPALEAALARLTGTGDARGAGMGELFKVLALTAPGMPVPPGFTQPIRPMDPTP